jgi:hypothetical protein
MEELDQMATDETCAAGDDREIAHGMIRRQGDGSRTL